MLDSLFFALLVIVGDGLLILFIVYVIVAKRRRRRGKYTAPLDMPTPWLGGSFEDVKREYPEFLDGEDRERDRDY